MVDASVVVQAAVGAATQRARLRERLGHETLHAPHLVDVEVLHALRRHVRAGALSDAAADEARRVVADLAITRYSHEGLAPRAWELRANLTAYDAVYVALAELLDSPLVTLDARLARAPGHHASTELVDGDDT